MQVVSHVQMILLNVIQLPDVEPVIGMKLIAVPNVETIVLLVPLIQLHVPLVKLDFGKPLMLQQLPVPLVMMLMLPLVITLVTLQVVIPVTLKLLTLTDLPLIVKQISKTVPLLLLLMDQVVPYQLVQHVTICTTKELMTNPVYLVEKVVLPVLLLLVTLVILVTLKLVMIVKHVLLNVTHVLLMVKVNVILINVKLLQLLTSLMEKILVLWFQLVP